MLQEALSLFKDPRGAFCTHEPEDKSSVDSTAHVSSSSYRRRSIVTDRRRRRYNIAGQRGQGRSRTDLIQLSRGQKSLLHSRQLTQLFGESDGSRDFSEWQCQPVLKWTPAQRRERIAWVVRDTNVCVCVCVMFWGEARGGGGGGGWRQGRPMGHRRTHAALDGNAI